MKILHTADWHIGKRLHKHELHRDFELFAQWLVDLVKKKNIDVVLVSGDVFDLANPSSEARTAYYRALLKVQTANCKLILTGGNHDSPSVLNAPSEILKSLDIHVVGGLPENIEDCLIPLQREGKTEAVVAAIPYLRDPDLRSVNEEIGYENRVEAVREGIARIFRHAAEACAEKFPHVPALAMGHLFAAGATTSESERDIQIGNEASFEAGRFGEYFDYVALGHIHRPQRVKANIPVLYSGSPLSLSFSERDDQKRVLLIDTEKGFEPENIPVPIFRELKRISGDLGELTSKLNSMTQGGELPTLLELELVEEQYNPASLSALDSLVQNFAKEGVEIVKHRASFKSRVSGAGELYKDQQQLEDLKPADVFSQLLEQNEFEAQTNELLNEAFLEILEEVQNPDAR